MRIENRASDVVNDQFISCSFAVSVSVSVSTEYVIRSTEDGVSYGRT